MSGRLKYLLWSGRVTNSIVWLSLRLSENTSTCRQTGPSVQCLVGVQADLKACQGDQRSYMEYTISWIGQNDQPGSQTIREGATCFILPSGKTDRANIISATFTSFQMAVRTSGSSVIGSLRGKDGEGKHFTILPGSVGQRFLLPQIHKWGLATQQRTAEGGDAEARITQEVQSNAGQSSGRETAEEGPQKRRRTDAQKQARREKEQMSSQACAILEKHQHWQGKAIASVADSRVESFKLGPRARCNKFGMERYAALKHLTFYRCKGCKSVSAASKTAKQHVCTDAARTRQHRNAAAVPAEAILPGGIQLHATMPLEVSFLSLSAHSCT